MSGINSFARYTAARLLVHLAAYASQARTALGLGTVATVALDTDGTMAADLDTRVASQKATRTYVAAQLAGVGSLLAANNLSDVASAAAALTNLGVPQVMLTLPYLVPGALPAADVNYVTVGVAATAANAFPGPFTWANGVPRNVSATFPAGWDGGNITATGTTVSGGAADTEVLVAVPGTTVVGNKIFFSIAGVDKGAVGVDAGVCSIGFGDKFYVQYLAYNIGILTVDGSGAQAEWSATEGWCNPAVVPDGVKVFQYFAPVQVY